MFDVIAIGELLIDFTCLSTDDDGYPTMAAHPGGAPANYLAALQKFGAKTSMIAEVGDDAFGKMLLHTLDEIGVDTRGISVCKDVFTTLAFVTFDASNDREFSFARKPGADTRLYWSETISELIEETQVIHFGTLSLTDEPASTTTQKAIAFAKQKGKLISFDPNLRKPLWNSLERAKEAMLWGLRNADVVKISDEEVAFLFGELEYEKCAEKIISNYGVSLVFITMGKHGCYFKNCNASGFVSAIKGINIIDTTGAGDIFGGSAMWKLLQIDKAPASLSKEELIDITQFACCAAGLSTTKSGGIFSVPSLSEVKAVLNND